MKADEAKQLADNFHNGEKGFNKKLYAESVREIKTAASKGQYSTVVTLYSLEHEAKAIAAKLTKDGFKVRCKWCPSSVGICGVNDDYASLNISWR